MIPTRLIEQTTVTKRISIKINNTAVTNQDRIFCENLDFSKSRDAPSILVKLSRTSPTIKYNKKNLTEIIRSRLKYDSKGLVINAFQIASNHEILKLAYETIKSKPGNMTTGVDKITLDGITPDWFIKTSKELRARSWKFKPVRRVLIPKEGGGTRPLGVGSPRDKIVQQSLRLVLEHVLEPKFQQCSYGFRPKRGCHTALKEVRSWKGCRWMLEGDIKKYFDSIDHHLLEERLKEHFHDPLLFDLYWKLAKAGYAQWDVNKKRWNFITERYGVPQGGILSPLLSNLFLHKLDEFIMAEIEARKVHNEGKEISKKNPKYTKINHRIWTITRAFRTGKQTYDTRLKRDRSNELKKLITARRRLYSLVQNPNHISLKYVRYADDWLIGVWGPKKYVENLKLRVLEFLRTIRLDLSLEKTLITSTVERCAKFLGAQIKTRAWKNKTNAPTIIKNGHLVSDSFGNIWMTAPIPNILERLKKKGFWKELNGRIWTLPLTKLLALPIKEMIIWFRSILAGYLNYFTFADNKSGLALIYSILKNSLKRTIAAKKKINVRAVTERYGPNVTLRILRRDGKTVYLDFSPPALSRTPHRFLGARIYQDPLSRTNWKISTIDAMGQDCANCGSDSRVEMHHLKHIKTINSKLDYFSQKMARINRKQVPLCRRCHLKVHKGEHAGFSLRHFYHIKYAGDAKWS